MVHEPVLATAIRSEINAARDGPHPPVIAHFVLSAISLAIRSPTPRQTLDAAFGVIVNGASIGGPA